MPTLFHHLSKRAIQYNGSTPAIIHKKSIWTYSQLNELVRQEAGALLGLGLQPHERVAIYLPKQIETVTGFLAISQAGGVFVPVNPALKAPQVGHILADCNVRILITSKSRLQIVASVLCECPDLTTVALVDHEPAAGEFTISQTVIGRQQFLTAATADTVYTGAIDTDMAAILYTSGSTGKPKGVVLSHRNMVTGARSVSEYLAIRDSDKVLAVLPFSFDYGLNQLTTCLLQGACCVLLNYLLPQDVINALVAHRITGLAAVPSLWAQLAGSEWPDSLNEHLRYMTSSGGKMPKAVLAALRKKVSNCRFFLMYGLTEAFRSTYLSPELIDERPDSIGKAIPNAEVLVVRTDGSPCRPQEPGELVHRGSLVALGYWNDPIKTAERFRPVPQPLPELSLTEIAVWSGDTVIRDEDGFLYFVGRKDDMIKTSGYRVSPTEIEEVCYASGLVKEAAAIGIEHSELGQAIITVVSVEKPADFDSQALITLCKTNLPNFMVPARVIVLDQLPRNPNGKIDRKALSQQFNGLVS
jgi:acyl-CoA ligase (AMP-forming) (exosortase A-associated)